MSIITQSSIYLISNIMNGLSLLFLLPFLTRALTPAEYSQVVLFQTLIFGLMSFIHLNVFQASNIKFFEKSISEENIKIFNAACVLIMGGSIIFFAFFYFLFQTHLSEIMSLPISWIAMSFVIAVAQTLIQFCLWQWQMRKLALKYSIFNSFYVILCTILTLGLLYKMKDQVDARIYSLLFVSLVFFCFQFTLFVRTNGSSYIKYL